MKTMSEVYHDGQNLPTKACSICRALKPLDAFYKAGKGLRTECKDCTLHKQRVKYQQEQNKKLTQLMLPPFISSKICTKCKYEKPIDEFVRGNPYTLDGYSYRCGECLKEDAKKRSLKVIDQSLLKRCGRCRKEKALEQFPVSAGYGKHGRSSICNDCVGARWQENKEKYMSTGAQWRKENPLKDRKRSQNYMARKKNAAIDNSIDYNALLEKHGMWCYICKQSILQGQSIQFDHVIPLVRGGPHHKDNLRPVHSQCNARKQGRLLEEMTPYQRRGV